MPPLIPGFRMSGRKAATCHTAWEVASILENPTHAMAAGVSQPNHAATAALPHQLLFPRQLLQQRLQSREDQFGLFLFQRELQDTRGSELAAGFGVDEAR